MLDAGKEIAKSSVTGERSNEPAFCVLQSPKNPLVYGIKNLLPYQWTCTQTGAKVRLVNNGEKVAALNGVNISFTYDFRGEISYSKM